jgi:hypothetical protein
MNSCPTAILTLHSNQAFTLIDPDLKLKYSI